MLLLSFILYYLWHSLRTYAKRNAEVAAELQSLYGYRTSIKSPPKKDRAVIVYYRYHSQLLLPNNDYIDLRG